MINVFIDVHHVCRKLWQAGIADYSHDKKSRPALCLSAKPLQSQRELRRINNRHEERYRKHGVKSDISAKHTNDDAKNYKHNRVEQQHTMRTELDHKGRTDPAPHEESQHIESEKRCCGRFIKSGIHT